MAPLKDLAHDRCAYLSGQSDRDRVPDDFVHGGDVAGSGGDELERIRTGLDPGDLADGKSRGLGGGDDAAVLRLGRGGDRAAYLALREPPVEIRRVVFFHIVADLLEARGQALVRDAFP